MRAQAPVDGPPGQSVRLAVWLAGTLLICYLWVLPHWDWNQNARLDMTVALVNHATVAIDRYNGNTGDKDRVNGHFYSSKAPGQSLFGIPVYLAYKVVLRAGGASAADTADDLALQDAEIIVTCALPSVLLLLLFFWYLGYYSPSPANRVLLTLALGLGTGICPYAQQLFGHVPAAALLFAGFALIDLQARQMARGPGSTWLLAHPFGLALLAGGALGTAVLIEYPPILIAGLVGLYALWHLPRRLIPPLLLGGVPAIVVILIYNAVVYHNPFTAGYTSGASVLFTGQQHTGFGGVDPPPTPEALWGLSFSPYRGLFFLSPWLLLMVPGLVLWIRRRDARWPLVAGICLVFFLTMASFVAWWGGLTVGPRYLIPLLPFAALPVISVLDALPRWPLPAVLQGLVLGAISISILTVWTETLGGTDILLPPENNLNPLFSVNLPALLHNQVYLNRGIAFGLSGIASLLPLWALIAVWSVLVPAASHLAVRRHIRRVAEWQHDG